MIIDKVVRNVYAIGAGIIVSAFGVSFISTKARRISLEYPTQQEFTGPIDSVSSIEDLEYSKGCKFYFYDPKLMTENGIKPAREYKTTQDKSKMFGKVKEKVTDCTKGRFFYIKPEE